MKAKTRGNDFDRAKLDDFNKTDAKNLTARCAPQEKEEKFSGEILSIAGILELTAESSIDDVKAALRQLRNESYGVDRLLESRYEAKQ